MRKNSSTLETWGLAYRLTDGVVEARNQTGEEWEVQGLLKAAAYGEPRSQNAGGLVDLIFRSMDDFSQGH